jgi:uncharacterized protein YjgD (DUF1641 family)
MKKTNYIIKLADAMDLMDKEREANILDKLVEHSSYMAKPQLAKIHEMARNLFFLLADNEEIDDWMESYIAQVEKMLTSVYDKLKYQKESYIAQNMDEDDI